MSSSVGCWPEWLAERFWGKQWVEVGFSEERLAVVGRVSVVVQRVSDRVLDTVCDGVGTVATDSFGLTSDDFVSIGLASDDFKDCDEAMGSVSVCDITMVGEGDARVEAFESATRNTDWHFTQRAFLPCVVDGSLYRAPHTGQQAL
ncbi:MAG: hypothetical protein FWC56_04705, partial [Phycisphaerae bacterium]|nr:hypothetical protein [Phycisphaerae bacterium]